MHKHRFSVVDQCAERVKDIFLNFFRVSVMRSRRRLLSLSHTYTTHGSRTKNSFIFSSASSCVMHSLLVRRARWANGIVLRHALRASTIFVHAQKCALSSTHEGGRHTHAECAGPAPDTRGTHAGYSLCARRLMRREHPAQT